MIRFACTLGLVLSGLAMASEPRPEWTDPQTGMVFVRIEGGCFRMGSDRVTGLPSRLWDQLGFRRETITADERPAHDVCLKPYWIGRHEVRAREWEKVMGALPPQGNGDQPAAGITWLQAQEFIGKFNKRMPGGEGLRLPTEAEWEYACRAGTRSPDEKAGVLPERDDHLEYAWYQNIHRPVVQLQPVGTLKPNAWGLHDMLGNASEWVIDAYRADAYVRHGLHDPVETSGNGTRVLRGGSFRSEHVQLRCAARSSYAEAKALPQFGLRLVRRSPQREKAR